MSDKKLTYFGNSHAAIIEDYALWVTDPHTANNRSAFGELLIAALSPKAAWRFDYTLNTRLYTSTTANGGANTVANSLASLSTSANAAGLARIQTQRRLRYLPGMGGLVRFTSVFDTPKNNNTQAIGLGDTVDRFFFGYAGTGFGVGIRRAGVDMFIGSDQWNGDKVNISPQLGNVYQIRYQWLGFGFIRFYILDPLNPANGFTLVHTIMYPNTAQVTSILNPTLPLFAEVLNSGNNTDVVLQTPSAMAALEGETSAPFNPLDVFNSFDASATYADTNNHHLMTLHNKSTFAAVANRVPIDLHNMNLGRSASGANTTTVRMYRNATTAIPLVFADIDTNNSPIEASITATTITGGTAEHTFVVTNNVTLQSFGFEDNEFTIQPGETVTMAIQDGGVQSTDFVGDLNWIEKF